MRIKNLTEEKIKLYGIVGRKIALFIALFLGISSIVKGLMLGGIYGLTEGIFLPIIFYISLYLAVKIFEKTLLRRIKLCQKEKISKKY
ncbi:MAG: hypothetical protein QMD92_06290 [bacterium]|nr:hypothetical protein [bacterium]